MTATELQPASVAAPRPELDWERDGNGRPRILPDPAWDDVTRQKWQAGRAWDDGTVGYTRVTTFAEALQDSSALTRWKLRRAVLGMGRRPDYVTTAAALTTRDEDRQALDDLAEKALEAAGPNAADVGTALHAFTERLDRGEELGAVPAEYEPTLSAYTGAVRHLRFVEYECRTVCDELEVAGTPDRVGFCDIPDPDGVVDELRIIDTKTGRVDYSAGKFSTQLAIYAHSALYHPGTGARTPLQELGAPISTRWGLVVHVPAGAGVAELLWINLEHGWKGAQHCLVTREWRAAASAGALLLPVFARPPRPATTDGTCRGRKQDGTACGYRRKARADGTAAQFCGRHGDQARDLERWWAENPGVDPADGVERLPDRDPVQPSTPPVQLDQPAPAVPREEQEAAAARSVAAQLERAEQLAEERRVAAYGSVADDPRECRDTAARRGVLSSLETLGVVPEQITHRFGRPVEHVATRHLTELVRDVIAQQRLLAQQRDDEADGTALHENAPDDAGPDRGEEADVAAATGLCSWCGGFGCTSCQPEDYANAYAASSTDLAAYAFAGAQAAADVAAQQQQPARELAPVGTYTLDPAAEVNGNPRPHSGLQTPEDAQAAAAAAADSVWQQIMRAQTETQLQLLYQRHADVWTPDLTEWAGRRSREIAQQQARERPEAALLTALRTAPDTGTLHRLFLQYGSGDLWTPAATAAAQARWEALQT